MIAIILFLLIVAYFLYKHYQVCKKFSNFPGPTPRWPLIGNVLDMLLDKNNMNQAILDKFLYYSNKYNKEGLFAIFIGSEPQVFLHKGETVSALLSSGNTMKSTDYDFQEPYLHDGIGNSSGVKWHHRRRTITTAFHLKSLDRLVVKFNKHSMDMVERFSHFPQTKIFDMSREIFYSGLKGFCDSQCGIAIDEKAGFEYIHAMDEIKDISNLRYFNPFLWSDIVFYKFYGEQYTKYVKIQRKFCWKLIHERREFHEKDNYRMLMSTDKRKLNFIDTLFRAQREKNAIDELGLLEEAESVVFAGHETSATTLSWAFLILGNRPDIQEKLRQEARSVIGPKERYLTREDVPKLAYTTAFLKETLRLYGTPPLLGRSSNESFKINDYVIPPNTTIHIFIYGLHRDPNVFPDPEEFRVERFLENTQQEKRNPFAFLPFSAGLRNCVGQKYALNHMPILMAHLVNNYKFESIERVEDVKPAAAITLSPVGGVKMRIKPVVK